jgi:hypothetical protein
MVVQYQDRSADSTSVVTGKLAVNVITEAEDDNEDKQIEKNVYVL